MVPGPTNIWGYTRDTGEDVESTPRRATAGSAGLDLRCTTRIVLTPQMGVQPLDTDFQGPLPKDTVGLLLGRSSSALKGLVIHPGVIDPDYNGVVKILASAPRGIVAISPGDRVAQLLLLPSLHRLFEASPRKRGDRGFGSSGTDSIFLSLGLDQRPLLTLKIDGRRMVGLLDTGADKSIIAQKDWPKAWPLQQSSQTLQGLGYTQSPNLSAKILSWKDNEGHEGHFQPYVLELPISLWGRDLLKELGFTLSNDYSRQAQTMMRSMGWDPFKGLGKNLQGIREPIQPHGQYSTTGLGFP